MEAKIAADGDEQNRQEEKKEDKLTYNFEMDFGRLSVRELETRLKPCF